MKRLMLAAVLALAAAWPTTAFAQWDYSQDSTYNMIEARIDARKTRARIQARKAKTARHTRPRRHARSRRHARRR